MYSSFEEEQYLEANPDVLAALKAGDIPSGEWHYRTHGFSERRSLKPGARPPPLEFPFLQSLPHDSRDKTLAGLDLSTMIGVEIGALASPLVTRAEGEIYYIDWTDTETLRHSYAADPNTDVSKLVDVDAIWGELTLAECLGGGKKVDYVLASHVIEHCPDLVTWLGEIHDVLKPAGSLRLKVPDRRFTFDILRRETLVADVLDAYLRRARIPQPRQIIEFCSLAREVDCVSAWAGTLDLAQLKPMSSTAFGLHLAEIALQNGRYFDTHCWVFTPQSFATLCLHLAELGLLQFKCDRLIPTALNELEFYVHLSKSDNSLKAADSWRDVSNGLLIST